MEQLKRQTLFSTEGGADKQYTIWIEPDSVGGYRVQAQWGPRGGSVQCGVKTGSAPVSMEKAEAIYDKTVKEKLAKGYHPGEDAPAFSQVEGAVDSGLRPMLLTDASERGPEEYILSDDWAAQEKMNGKRIMLRVAGGRATGVNRCGLECPIPKAVSNFFSTWVATFTLDGELIGDVYHAFDRLARTEGNLRVLGTLDRYETLKGILSSTSGPVRYVPLVTGADAKRALVEKLRAGRREGVVFKRLDAPYTPGRIENLKRATAVKCKFYKEATLRILHWNDKSSIAVAADSEDEGTVFDGNQAFFPVGNVTVPAKYKDQIDAALSTRNPLVRVRYLYATANRILYQPNLDPDSAGRVVRDDAAEADQLSSLKLEGKGVMHTPTPWAFDKDRCAIVSLSQKDMAGSQQQSVISTFGAMGGDDTKADREFIVRAVNAHDELLEVVSVCARMDCQREQFEKKRCPDIFGRERWCAPCLARAAISKAKKEG